VSNVVGEKVLIKRARMSKNLLLDTKKRTVLAPVYIWT
jgi:hypothetical protein